MPSRIIRSDDSDGASKISTATDVSSLTIAVPQDHIMNVEKQAFEQGYREGERIGKQMGERMVDATIKRYERSIAALVVAQKNLALCMERESVLLALEIARRMLRRELAVDPGLAAEMAARAVKRVTGQPNVVLRVSRDDIERIQATVDSSNSAVSIREDAALERGDFVLDTDQTHLDGRLMFQMENIGRFLLEGG